MKTPGPALGGDIKPCGVVSWAVMSSQGKETRESEGRTCEGWGNAHMCVCPGGGHVGGRDWHL